jgi:RNA ligase (TIGR02306 family)
VTKGDYKVGDLAAYISIDTIVPDNETFAFMIPPKQIQKIDPNGKTYHEVFGKKFEVGSVPESFRIIKAKKIRGVYSQGMLLKGNQGLGYESGSLNFTDLMPYGSHCDINWFEGDSITDFFGLTKWEEPEDDESRFHNTGNGTSGKAPFFRVPYYDIEAARKFTDSLHPGEIVIIEEKIHGCNAAFTHDGERLWVKSRNLFKARDESCLWWDIAIRYNLEELLRCYPYLTFFGEIYGQVKGFPYDADSENPTKVRFFDVYDVKNQRFLDFHGRDYAIETLGLPKVPLLEIGNWDRGEWDSIKQNLGEGKSTLNKNHVREGFVIRPIVERQSIFGRTILKHVGESYNLSKLVEKKESTRTMNFDQLFSYFVNLDTSELPQFKVSKLRWRGRYRVSLSYARSNFWFEADTLEAACEGVYLRYQSRLTRNRLQQLKDCL